MSETQKKGAIPALLVVLFNIAWWVVAAALALAIGWAAVSPWFDVHGPGSTVDIPVSFSVDPGTVHVSAPTLGIKAAAIERVRGSMRFPPPSKAMVVALLAFLAVMLALVLWVIGQLRAVARTLRDRQPFAPDNVARIRRIGYAVILGELARSAVVFSANAYAATHFSANGLRFDARLDLSTAAIVHGLIILAIAEVFRAGTRLNEDQSLTI